MSQYYYENEVVKYNTLGTLWTQKCYFPFKIRRVSMGAVGGVVWGGGWKGCVYVTGFLFAIKSEFICEISHTELCLVQKSKTSSDH